MTQYFGKYFFIAGVAGAVALATTSPASAQSCAALNLVGAPGTQVEKTVSVPGASVLVRNNWHTDFAIPADRSYNAFVGTVTPKNSGIYSVQMALKYPNETADTVFNEKLELKEGQPFRIRGTARRNAQPYQVNLVVGGVEAVGNSYVAAAAACQ